MKARSPAEGDQMVNSGLRSQNSMKRINSKQVNDNPIKYKKYRTITPNEGVRHMKKAEYSTLDCDEVTGILSTQDGNVSQITK
jgi:hypothetical protein